MNTIVISTTNHRIIEFSHFSKAPLNAIEPVLRPPQAARSAANLANLSSLKCHARFPSWIAKLTHLTWLMFGFYGGYNYHSWAYKQLKPWEGHHLVRVI